MRKVWARTFGYAVWLNVLIGAGFAINYLAGAMPKRTLFASALLAMEVEGALLIGALVCALVRAIESRRLNQGNSN
jgi:hypothetical protein